MKETARSPPKKVPVVDATLLSNCEKLLKFNNFSVSEKIDSFICSSVPKFVARFLILGNS